MNKTMNSILRRGATLLCVILLFVGAARAQSALDGFDPNANGIVRVIVVQPDGKILIGGDFTTVLGVTRNRIARLNSDGTLDTAFNPDANGFVLSITVQSDGKILVGGSFTTIGGQPRNRIARLSNDTPALSTLSATQTTLTLTRNGSAALLARVIFEQSTDNGATYTLLGTATNSQPTPAGKDTGDNQLAPNAAGYTLTGLNLPAAQNMLIRARGFYRTSNLNGSETIEDKVQQVFFALFPTASGVTIGGYVQTHLGHAPRRATVTLADTNGNVWSTTVNRFGHYLFTDVAPGQIYFVTVEAKGYNFTPPTHVVAPNFDVEDLNFTAFPPPN